MDLKPPMVSASSPSMEPLHKDGVLTITVEADFVILTGKLSGIDALKREGIETIVFIANNEASIFKTADLLEKASGGSGERF